MNNKKWTHPQRRANELRDVLNRIADATLPATTEHAPLSIERIHAMAIDAIRDDNLLLTESPAELKSTKVAASPHAPIEYLVITIDAVKPLEPQLNTQGAEGWTLVYFKAEGYAQLAVFMRPKV